MKLVSIVASFLSWSPMMTIIKTAQSRILLSAFFAALFVGLGFLVSCGGGWTSDPSAVATTPPAVVVPPVVPPATCSTTPPGGPITPNIIVSRVTGVAPLAVFFDASATTATATTRPFHDLEYRWSFGETTGPGIGTWSTGSRAGVSSRNSATGPVAAHVYETPGTYTVALVATDGTNTVTENCVQITVQDPDVVFAGANTVCIANGGATAGMGGCPAGAATPPATAAFDTALAACLAGAAPRRCLFKRGDTFASALNINISIAGPLTVGAYGLVGNLPIINATTNTAVFRPFNPAVNDLRIMDLEIVGSGPLDTGLCISVIAQVTNVTILRLSCHDRGRGIIIASGSNITGSVIQDSNIYNLNIGGGVGIFGWAINSAFLGNSIGPFNPGSEHNIRLQPGQRVAISNNTLTTPGEDGSHGKQVLTIRALEHANPNLIDTSFPNGIPALADTQYVYISDNKLSGGNASAQMFQIGPAGDTQNNWISDVIAERNWIVFGSVTQQGLYGEASNITVRDNICNSTGGLAGGRFCYSNDHTNTAGVLPPNNNRYYNNTCYDNSTGSSFCVTLGFTNGVTVTNSVVQNNVAYTPSATSPQFLFIPAGSIATGTTASNNSTNPQMLSASPLFSNGSGNFSLVTDFKPTTGSYAIGAGTSVPVWSDFFLVAEPSPRDMGAVNH